GHAVVALVGPAGCGKSTLLRLFAGLARPADGTVLYRGQPLDGVLGASAMVFQSFALLPWLTVAQNVAMGLEARGVHGPAQRDAVARAINLVGLDGFEQAYPKELSGGMKQRVCFARALAGAAAARRVPAGAGGGRGRAPRPPGDASGREGARVRAGRGPGRGLRPDDRGRARRRAARLGGDARRDGAAHTGGAGRPRRGRRGAQGGDAGAAQAPPAVRARDHDAEGGDRGGRGGRGGRGQGRGRGRGVARRPHHLLPVHSGGLAVRDDHRVGPLRRAVGPRRRGGATQTARAVTDYSSTASASATALTSA